MDKVKEIAKGKAKSMFTTSNPGELIMEFRDDASAFDGKKRASLAGKGAVNNQFNAFIMNYLGDNGVEHHLINLIDSEPSSLESSNCDTMKSLSDLAKAILASKSKLLDWISSSVVLVLPESYSKVIPSLAISEAFNCAFVANKTLSAD